MSPDDRILLYRLIRGIGLVPLLFGVPLFVAAGTLAWPDGWVFLAIQVGGTATLSVMLWRHDPALLAERMKGLSQPGQPAWDRALLRGFMLAFLAWLVVMGLDAVRFGWSAAEPRVKAVGAALQVAGYAVMYATFRANTFLVPVVRIQQERGHRVISSGPYRIVRHPMYAGALALFGGAPLQLGSWWGLLAAAGLGVLLALRVLGEEAVLRRDLPGYAAYTAQVRYRLLPGIW